jgi:hypothetical protein
MVVAPHLIEQESSLDEFVALENGDVVQAAKRLVSYWTLRRTLFKQRAYLPLNLSTGRNPSHHSTRYSRLLLTLLFCFRWSIEW